MKRILLIASLVILTGCSTEQIKFSVSEIKTQASADAKIIKDSLAQTAEMAKVAAVNSLEKAAYDASQAASDLAAAQVATELNSAKAKVQAEEAKIAADIAEAQAKLVAAQAKMAADTASLQAKILAEQKKLSPADVSAISSE